MTQNPQAATNFIRPTDVLPNSGKLPQARTPLTKDLWKLYQEGLSHCDQKNIDQGIETLSSLYKKFKENPITFDSLDQRIVARGLKKLGWCWRQKEEYEKAYAYHNIEFTLSLRSGSFAELHDAAISLDVDAYYLGDPQLSETWSVQSVGFGEQIPNAQDKFRALGISYNNLAGSQSILKNFFAAESSILKSLQFWQRYEELAGKAENRLVWAFFGIADIYENWASHIKTSDPSQALTKAESAIGFYNQAEVEGKERGMDAKSLEMFKSKPVEIKSIYKI